MALLGISERGLKLALLKNSFFSACRRTFGFHFFGFWAMQELYFRPVLAGRWVCLRHNDDALCIWSPDYVEEKPSGMPDNQIRSI